jgi:hypothetical protein
MVTLSPLYLLKISLIFEYREEGLFNLQSCAFLCHSEIHEKEKFSTGPTCDLPNATCLLTLAALRYFPPPHCSCSHMLSPYLFSISSTCFRVELILCAAASP